MSTRLPFQVATFLGALLLFAIQPLLAKHVLPWFGGGSAVWSASLLFFQIGLVGGYAYAHLTRRFGLPRQAWIHLALLAIAIVTLPAAPGDRWKPPDGEDLVSRIVWLLAANVGLPYVLLAATAPMLQDWFARVTGSTSEVGQNMPRITEGTEVALPLSTTSVPAVIPTVDVDIGAPFLQVQRPYRLYVLSNVGSLAALAAYPTIIEPRITLQTQHLLWSALFVVFVLTCAWCAWTVRSAPSASVSIERSPAPIGMMTFSLWVLLPAIGSGLLLATTSTLTQDVSAIPLIWILPLALYLITFILAFAGWYWRPIWIVVYAATLALTIHAFRDATAAPAALQAGALLFACFGGCMVCHGELVSLRPPVERLTTFYLAMSIGGAVGGAFVALAAPMLFNTMIELPILHVVTVVAIAALGARAIPGRAGVIARIVAPPVSVAAVVLFGASTWRQPRNTGIEEIEVDRGFYGVVRVTEEPDVHIRRLYHGRILHGLQFTTPTLTMLPTSYYVEGSGVELAIRQHPRRLNGEPLKIGVVGLGTGSVAAWGARGDRINFFEIDPVVIALSGRHFSYMRESPATSEVVRGDARLSLEREVATPSGLHSYDLLILDAFSGDAIPIHLLTVESFRLYEAALKPDGALVVHVSNRYLDLRPVVRGISGQLGYEVVEVFREGEYTSRAAASTWMIVTRNAALLDAVRPKGREPEDDRTVVWTDNFSSILAVWNPR